MPLYECVLIARNDVTQQQVEGVADNIATQLEAEGGAVKKREYWGLRGLAYRIKKNRKGHYMLLGLDAKPAFISEMERQLSLNEDMLRFMTVRVEEIEEAPSAILLHLLKRHPQFGCERLLAHLQHQAAHAHAPADVHVGRVRMLGHVSPRSDRCACPRWSEVGGMDKPGANYTAASSRSSLIVWGSA